MADKQGPVRKHWRWTGRIYGVIGVFLLATLAARIWWGYYADGKLQAILDEIAARGEPIEWADLKPAPVSDDKNAAILYRKAAEIPLLAATNPDVEPPWRHRREPAPEPVPNADRLYRLRTMILPLVQSRDFRREHSAEMREIIKLSQGALALCRQGGQLEGCDWGIDFDAPAMDYTLPPMGDLRNLAKLLCLAALDAHIAGNDAAAVAYLQDVWAIGRHIGSVPSVIGHFVAMAVDSLAANALETIMPDLAIGDQPGRVSRESVENLIRALLDTTSLTSGLTYAMISERSMTHDTVEGFRASWGNAGELPLPSRMILSLIDPMWKLDEVRLLHFYNAFIAATRESTHASMKARYRTMFPMLRDYEERSWGSVKYYTRMLSAMLMPSLEGNTFTMNCRGIAKRRMAGIALAMRLYEIDNGRRPAKLADMVPKYLPAIPADPFDSSNGLIRYLPDPKQPLLYSAGRNGRDDSGNFSIRKSGYVDRDEGDMPFFLNGDRPSGKPDWEDPALREKQVRSGRSAGRRSARLRRGTQSSQPTSRRRRARRR